MARPCDDLDALRRRSRWSGWFDVGLDGRRVVVLELKLEHACVSVGVCLMVALKDCGISRSNGCYVVRVYPIIQSQCTLRVYPLIDMIITLSVYTNGILQGSSSLQSLLIEERQGVG